MPERNQFAAGYPEFQRPTKEIVVRMQPVKAVIFFHRITEIIETVVAWIIKRQ